MADWSNRVLRPLVFVLTLGMLTVAFGAQGAMAGQGFDWFANAKTGGATSRAEAIARTKAAIRLAGAVTRGATWVCSPAGSGRRSSCYKS